MIKIKIRDNELVGSLIRRFKRASQFKKFQIKKNEYFIKPSKRRSLSMTRKNSF